MCVCLFVYVCGLHARACDKCERVRVCERARVTSVCESVSARVTSVCMCPRRRRK